MTRTEITTNYTSRDKPWDTFLVTELLDFLMTEDDNYLVTKKGASYTSRIKPTTLYS